MMTEKTRNLMLKNTAPTSQHNSSISLTVFRGTALITQLEAQKHPTTFVAVSSDFDNHILPACPQIPILTTRTSPPLQQKPSSESFDSQLHDSSISNII
uniref:Uncharacterized protein n=1 Tax=Caenorhabditis japonica TaxID=281687 RepID=A0A8R1HUP0_CAEJA